jgi:hypothetical protein
MAELLNGSRAVAGEAGAECATGDQIASAASWLADNWHVAPQPITRTLREMFGLNFLDAVKAMARAKAMVEALA